MTTKPKGRRVKVGERLRKRDMIFNTKLSIWETTGWPSGKILSDQIDALNGPYIRPTNPRTPRRTGRRGKTS